MIDRVAGLLETAPDEPETDFYHPTWPDRPPGRGYLDLLSESPTPHDTIAQRLMRSGLLPKMRPHVGRGPGRLPG